MKKRLKIITILSFTIMINTNLVTVISCDANSNSRYFIYTQEQIQENQKLSNIYKIYFSNYPTSSNPYQTFILQSKNQLDKTASPSSKNEFDNLYDTTGSGTIWASFDDLQKDLTTYKISNQVTVNINWNKMLQQLPIDTATRTNAQKLLLRMYNIFAETFQKENVLRFLQSAIVQNFSNPGVLAAVSGYFNGKWITMQLSTKALDQALITQDFLAGHFSSGTLLSTIIHEYGHALSFYSQLPPSARATVNTTPLRNMLRKKTYLSQNYFNDIFTDPTSVLMGYLDQKANINPNNETESLIYPLLVVNSGYSQSSWKNNDVNQRDELFAEAISRWAGTDSNNRNYNWELLNDFFMNYLPLYYNYQ